MAKKHSPKFLDAVEQSRSTIKECYIEQFKSMLDDGELLRVIDVRETHEFDAGCLEGSIHLSKGILERDIEKH